MFHVSEHSRSILRMHSGRYFDCLKTCIPPARGIFCSLTSLRCADRLLVSMKPFSCRSFFLTNLRYQGGMSSFSDQIDDRARSWNSGLATRLAVFASDHGSECTVLIFSTWECFNKVFDAPEAYGFTPRDVSRLGGAIWFDHVHPTSAFHRIMARDISEFLSGVEPHF